MKEIMAGKDDLLIAMFRIGKENISNGITREQMIALLRERRIAGAFSDPEHCSGQFERYMEQFFEHDRVGGITSDNRYLSWLGYLELLKYEELEQARESSRKSFVVAIVAIGISTLSFLVSIYFELQTSDIQFPRPQFVKSGGLQP